MKRAVLLGLVLMVVAADASAAGYGGNVILGLLNAIIELLNSGIARALAIIAVIGLGISGLNGHIHWERAIVVVLAIGIIFGAAFLVDLAGGGV